MRSTLPIELTQGIAPFRHRQFLPPGAKTLPHLRASGFLCETVEVITAVISVTAVINSIRIKRVIPQHPGSGRQRIVGGSER